ncbi:MAG: SpoIIE family protein phosphatase [Fusobacteriota bacterium]
MKDKILVLSESIRSNKNLQEKYNLIFSEEEFNKDIDMIIVKEKDIHKLSKIDYNDCPVLINMEEETKLDNIKNKYNYKISDYILNSYKEFEIFETVNNNMAINKLKREKELLEKKEKVLMEKIKEINEKNKKLIMKAKKYEDEVNIDPKSNLYNKKYITKQLNQEFIRSKRSNRPFSVAILKVDGIDKINDRYGNLINDSKILYKISEILSETVRGSDLLGRIAHNTFLIILPEIIEKYTIKVIKRISNRIKNIEFNSQKLFPTIGFIILDEYRINKIDSVNEVYSILEKLVFYSEKSNVDIVEYKEENEEDIKKVQEVLPGESELEEKHNLVWEELNKSKEFIEKLLPRKTYWSQKLKYSYYYYPFNFIGGDFFDFVEIDEDKVAIIFCDVSGHGVSSALYITAIKYIFSNIIKKEGIIEPSEFMQRFNESILEIAEGNIFVATTYGYVDKKNKEFVYSFGGGTSPIKIDTTDKSLEFLAEGGFIIGLLEEAYFETRRVSLNSNGNNEILFFYSDGIYEFLIEEKRIKSEKDFYKIIRENIEEDGEKFLQNIYELMQSKVDNQIDFDDDITLLAIQS